MRALFLDRDGTITVGVPTISRVDSVEKVALLPHVLEGLEVLAALNYLVFFVTNQAGMAEGLIDEATFNEINGEVLRLIEPSGIKITDTYLCPHDEKSKCDCRKPKPKLLLDASAKYDIDLSQSWMIGDRLTDIQTGINAGTKTILVRSGEIDSAPLATYEADDLLEVAKYITAQEHQT